MKDGFLVPAKAVSVPLKFQREGIKLGMAALTGLLGWPFAVGLASTTLGLFWGYPLIARLF